MKSFIRLFAVATVLLITAHRLPAPISEIPEPTATARKAKSKPPAKTQSTNGENESRSQPTAKPTPTRATVFAGNWTGTALGVAQTFPLSDKNSSTYSIHISPDEKRISVEETRNPYGNIRQGQIACRGDGNSLAWNYEQQVVSGNRMFGRCTLRINSDGSAALADDREYRGLVTLAVKITATLTKQ